MPKGFNRLGSYGEMKPNIFEKFEDGWGYDTFNVPVMTNHRDGMCLKCIAKEGEKSLPDFYEEKQHENYLQLPRIEPQELKTYKHQDLMKELNDMMIRIKRHLFGIAGDTIRPENEELDTLTNKLMAVLREDNEPMVKH